MITRMICVKLRLKCKFTIDYVKNHIIIKMNNLKQAIENKRF